jgi:hypothetical protein
MVVLWEGPRIHRWRRASTYGWIHLRGPAAILLQLSRLLGLGRPILPAEGWRRDGLRLVRPASWGLRRWAHLVLPASWATRRKAAHGLGGA